MIQDVAKDAQRSKKFIVAGRESIQKLGFWMDKASFEPEPVF